MKKRILIFTGLAKVNKNIVGTAVIYKEMAGFLNRSGFRMGMVVPQEADNKTDGIEYYVYSKKNNEKLIRGSDIVIFGSYPPIEAMEYAYRRKKKIITYMWSIAPIGSLDFEDFKSIKKQSELHQSIVRAYNKSLELSDKVFCRDNRARDLILGSLIALGRISLEDYRKGRNFNYLIEAAPFGIPREKCKHNQNVYRGIISGIEKNDFILLWNGGIWNRTDAAGTVEVMKYIWSKNKKIKLIFQGFYNPHKIYTMEARQALAKAKEAKLLDKNIFISKNWIEYDNRGDYLREVDAGITLSPNIPDANYFIKTRFYDYLWAELPIILNEYETFAKEVDKYGLGLVLEGDYKNQAEQVVGFVRNKKLQAEIKKNIRKYKKQLSWDKQLQKVVDYCR